MKYIIFLLLFFATYLNANTQLQRNYYVTHPYVTLSDIFPESKDDTILYRMEHNKHILRVKEKKLLAILSRYGYKNLQHKYPYIQFTQKSPINTIKLENAIKKLYSKLYSDIEIIAINTQPRNFITQLPKNYTIHFPKKAYLKQHATFYIKTPQKHKIFFDYEIKARINVYITRNTLHKGDELSTINLKKKSIMLKKFAAMPLQELHSGMYEAKHTIKQSQIVTQRDILPLVYIKRGSDVSVWLEENGIAINFSAKALQNGRLHEIIKVKNKNRKTIKVRVTGRNKAEVI